VAADTSVDLWTLEILTVPIERLAGAAQRSWQREEQRQRRDLATYLSELAGASRWAS